MEVESPRPEDTLIPGPQYEDTPEDYEGPTEYVNWEGYKIAINGASRLTPEFFNEIQNRRKNNQAIIIVVTGPPGEGKSYLAQRFCQIFDPRFNIVDEEDLPDVEALVERTKGRPGDPSQIVFERHHLLFLIGNDSPLKYGQCIMIDEAQYAMGSRHWYKQLQKDLMEAIESVRSRGYIILIVALHLQLLDRIIRKYVLTYMFHVEERGKAVVYRLYTPRFEKEMQKKRLGVIHLQLPDKEVCENGNCLRCNYLRGTNHKDFAGRNPKKRRCMTLRARYERRKAAFTGGRSAEAEERARVERKPRGESVAELAKRLYPTRGEIKRLRNGRYSPAHIQFVLEGMNVKVGPNKATRIRDRLEFLEAAEKEAKP